MGYFASETHPSPQFYTWTTKEYIYIAAETVVGILTVLTNGLVLLAMMRYSSLRTITNCYIGSLSVADILVGLLVPPLIAVTKAGLPRNFYACVLINSLVLVCVTISVLSLFCVALDRYWAVLHPIARRKVATTGRALQLVAAMWVLGIFIGLIPLMGWHNSPEGFGLCSFVRVIDLGYIVYLNFFGFIIPILLAMLYMHVHILVAFRSMCKNRTGKVPEGRTPITARELKMFKTLSLMFGLFALCWLPLNIIDCMQLWFGVHVDIKVINFAVLLTHCNSFIDPILYAINQPGFRRVLKNYVPRFFTHDKDATDTDLQSVSVTSRMYVEPGHEGRVGMAGQADQICTEVMTPHMDSKSLHQHSVAEVATEEKESEVDMTCIQILSPEKVNPTVMTESPLSSKDIEPMIAISGEDSSKGMELVTRKLSGPSTNTENKSATLITKNSGCYKEMGLKGTMNTTSCSYENLGLIAPERKGPSPTEQTEQIANGKIDQMCKSPSSTEQTEQIANCKIALMSNGPSSTEQTEQIANGKIDQMCKSPSSSEQREQIANGKIDQMCKSRSFTEQREQIANGKIDQMCKSPSSTEQREQIANGKIDQMCKSPSSTEQREQIANGKIDQMCKSPSSTEQREQIANGKIDQMCKSPSSYFCNLLLLFISFLFPLVFIVVIFCYASFNDNEVKSFVRHTLCLFPTA